MNNNISEQNTTANDHCVDCKDYKQLLENIKEKINTVPKRKQISLLILAPDSWTQQKIACYFNVKLYSLRKVASLKKEQGILPKVLRKKWHQPDDDEENDNPKTLEFQEFFYYDQNGLLQQVAVVWIISVCVVPSNDTNKNLLEKLVCDITAMLAWLNSATSVLEFLSYVIISQKFFMMIVELR